MRPWFTLVVAISFAGAGIAPAEAAARSRGTSVNAPSVQPSSSTTISRFARTKPPRAYVGKNPSQAARPQSRR